MKADIANSLSARCARARVYSHTYEPAKPLRGWGCMGTERYGAEQHEGARSRLRSNKSERKWTEPVEKVVFLKKQAEFRTKGGEMQTKVRLYCRLDRGS